PASLFRPGTALSYGLGRSSLEKPVSGLFARFADRSSPPAELQAFLGGDGGNAVDRLVGDELGARIREVLSFRRLRLLAGLGEFIDRLHGHGRHLQRILLGGRADDAVLDVLDPRAAA